ncbi:unnamed protein product [Symbiodinium microadriaticum]|nr:unnamed protein product [Symbiodinium microadriaticum]
MPASFADASPPHATPAEVDQSALPPQVPPMPCAAAMTGNAHHPQLHAFAADRVLPALPCGDWGHPIVVPAEGPLFCQRGRGPVVPIVAPSPALATPAADWSRGLASDDPLMRDVIGAEAAQRIAVDLQAITQGMLSTRADRPRRFREGVADPAEGFDSKIDGLRERFITETDRIFDENRRK